ncbi:hypothetical protein WDU94_010200 [Cyamophila willieti]
MTHLPILLLLCYASRIQGDYGAAPSPAPSYNPAPAPSYNPAPAYKADPPAPAYKAAPPPPAYNPAPAYKASPAPSKDPYSTRSGLGDPIVKEDTYKEKKTTSYTKEEKEDYRKGFINDKGECMCKAPRKKNKKKAEDPGDYKAVDPPKGDYRAAPVDPAPKIDFKNASPPASSYNSYNPAPAPGGYNAAPPAPAPGGYNAAPPAKY